jgi:inosine/guanosine/xanthosine phosphorylase family protein
MINRQLEKEAKSAASYVRKHLNVDIARTFSIGVVLGSGWGDALKIKSASAVELRELPWFYELRKLKNPEGHERQLLLGKIGKKNVAVLRGRIHLYESPFDKNLLEMVRLQVEMLFHLGVKTLILTNAAGSLGENILVGDIVVAGALVTQFAPDTMPLWGDEFCSPEDALDEKLAELALGIGNGLKIATHLGPYAMVRGPFFEGRKYDKEILRRAGAVAVGMSTLPEACIADLYGVKVLCLSFITNTASEKHSHEENVRRAEANSEKLGVLLNNIINRLE